MENTKQHVPQSIDVTGLPAEAICAVESLVSIFRAQTAAQGGVSSFASRDLWIKAIREWAAGHEPLETSADWSRESIYAGRGQ
jgi:hypothetical protein